MSVPFPFFVTQPDGSLQPRPSYCADDEHDWQLGLLGTGRETCAKCGLSQPRSPAATPEEEKRLQYAEEGFTNAANYIADALATMAEEAEQASVEAQIRMHTTRQAAQRARLIGKGRG